MEIAPNTVRDNAERSVGEFPFCKQSKREIRSVDKRDELWTLFEATLNEMK